MAKMLKEPWNVFEHNMNKAWGLVKLQFYADDLVRTGGKQSIGRMMDFIGDMFKSFGVTEYSSFQEMLEKELGPIIEREFLPKLEQRLRLIPEERLEKAGKAWLERNADRLKEFETVLEQLLLAIERVLLEQALVSSVTALEVYVHDVTEEVVAKNVFMQKRFTTQLHDGFKYKSIIDANRNLEMALGKVVASSYDYYDSKSLRRHLTSLVGAKAPLSRSNDMRKFETILAYRHLIVHRAGVVDPVFVKQTGYKGRKDTPVRLSRKYVEQALVFLTEVGNAIQNGLVRQKA